MGLTVKTIDLVIDKESAGQIFQVGFTQYPWSYRTVMQFAPVPPVIDLHPPIQLSPRPLDIEKALIEAKDIKSATMRTLENIPIRQFGEINFAGVCVDSNKFRQHMAQSILRHIGAYGIFVSAQDFQRMDPVEHHPNDLLVERPRFFGI